MSYERPDIDAINQKINDFISEGSARRKSRRNFKRI